VFIPQVFWQQSFPMQHARLLLLPFPILTQHRALQYGDSVGAGVVTGQQFWKHVVSLAQDLPQQFSPIQQYNFHRQPAQTLLQHFP
jgi:hypothetical protein